MRFLVLGPVQALAGGTSIPLGRRRERLVLGALVLHAGRAVPVERLAAAAWPDEEPPDNARQAIKVSASRLRKALAPYGVTIVARGDAYTLMADVTDTDAGRFRADVAAALALADNDGRTAALRAALTLWHGDVLEDVAGPDVRRALAADLTELRLAAQRRCIEADIGRGRVSEAIAELRGLVAANPTHEGFAGLLMTALVDSGRPAEAIDAYADLRRVLADDLGVDPGPDVSRLHVQILRMHDPGNAGPVPAAGGRPVQTLPRDVPGFTGRDTELARLDGAVINAGPLVVVTGPGGVGKTALAVHWAHRAVGRFPDGQLFVNLRGYGTAQPCSTNEALTQLLLALGERLSSIPPDVDAAAVMLRARLFARRMLIVVDNAASAEQVRPLLPGTGACGVIVTSRDPLNGLTAGEGAERISLRELGDQQALAVLRGVLGHRRVENEQAAAADLAGLCGGLPLALRVAAANLAAQPDRSLSSYRAQMRRGNVLDALQVDGDLTMGVRATLSSSYQSLSKPARRLFRLLGVPAGADFTLDGCAALTGDAPDSVQPVIDELCRAHLVTPQTTDRYALHDLVRAYAVELGVTADETELARDRLLGYYLASANRAARVTHQIRRYLDDDPIPPELHVLAFDSREAAHVWFDAEAANMVAEAQRASITGPMPFVWKLCDALAGYFFLRRHASLWAEMIEAAERASAAAGERLMAAMVLNRRGIMSFAFHDYPSAQQAFRGVVTAARELGDLVREAAALGNLSAIAREAGDLADARALASRALDIHLANNARDQGASCLITLAAVASDMDDVEASVAYGRRAEAIYRELNHPDGVASALFHIADALSDAGAGYAELAPIIDEATAIFEKDDAAHGIAGMWALHSIAVRNDGRYADAVTSADRAYETAVRAGVPGMVFNALFSRAEAFRALGDLAAAKGDYHGALERARLLGIRSGIVAALIPLAEIAFDEGETDRGRAFASEALALADRPRHLATAKRLMAAPQATF